MNSTLAALMGVAAMFAAKESLAPAAQVGKPAPAFTLTDSKGKAHSLADYKGSLVVLEWNNKDCPFVKKHYNSGNMQKLQKDYTAKGVIWLSIASSAKGREGFVDAAGAEKMIAEKNAVPTAYLLDADGKVGHLYGSKNTPTMYIVDKAGTLVYWGGIDDKPSADASDIPGAKNYVKNALDELLAGKPVTDSQTQPYGCGVKYDS